MPDKVALELASQISNQNLSKEGWTTYYVDGTNGNDGANGLTWNSALATIQHAVDIAESWATIYIKAGTYDEFIIISKDGISLIGQNQSNTLIQPSSSGHILEITGNNVRITNIKFDVLPTSISAKRCVFINEADNITIKNCTFIARTYIKGMGVYIYRSSKSIIDSLTIESAYMIQAITFYSTSTKPNNGHIIRNCIIKNSNTGISIQAYSESIKIHDNTISDCTNTGIQCAGTGTKGCIVFHNSLISNVDQVYWSVVSDNKFIENYYDDSTTDENNDGIVDTPYSINTPAGFYDYAPVSKRNGWNQVSLGNVAGSSIAEIQADTKTLLQKATKTITLSRAAVPVTESLFTVTGEVELYIVGYIDAAVTSAGALTLEVGIAGATAGLIAQTAVGALLIDLLWIDATPAILISKPSEKIIANGADISHIIKTAAATAGAITYYAWWKAISADGNVTAA